MKRDGGDDVEFESAELGSFPREAGRLVKRLQRCGWEKQGLA